MKKSEAKGLRVCFSLFVIISLMLLGNRATAVTLDSVPHIHHVKVVENKVLVLTHEGLYELVGKNNMKLVGKERLT